MPSSPDPPLGMNDRPSTKGLATAGTRTLAASIVRRISRDIATRVLLNSSIPTTAEALSPDASNGRAAFRVIRHTVCSLYGSLTVTDTGACVLSARRQAKDPPRGNGLDSCDSGSTSVTYTWSLSTDSPGLAPTPPGRGRLSRNLPSLSLSPKTKASLVTQAPTWKVMLDMTGLVVVIRSGPRSSSAYPSMSMVCVLEACAGGPSGIARGSFWADTDRPARQDIPAVRYSRRRCLISETISVSGACDRPLIPERARVLAQAKGGDCGRVGT